MSDERSQPYHDSLAVPAAVGPPPFAATRAVMPAAVRVVLTGELDMGTVPIAERELRDAEGEARQVTLDVRGLTFIDACGLHMILEADSRARRAGGRLVVAYEGSRCVRRLFELTGADEALELSDGGTGVPAGQNGAGPRRA